MMYNKIQIKNILSYINEQNPLLIDQNCDETKPVHSFLIINF